MDKRVLLAMVLSFLVIVFFHYLYIKFFPPEQKHPSPKTNGSLNNKVTSNASSPISDLTQGSPSPKIQDQTFTSQEQLYIIETSRYKTIITSSGARFQSLLLKDYSKEKEKREPVEMISGKPESLPIEVYLETKPEIAILPYRGPENGSLRIDTTKTLVFSGEYQNISIEKHFTFKPDSYYLDFSLKLINKSSDTLNDKLLLRAAFSPFVEGSQYVFKGPFYYTTHLNEVKLKDNKVEEFSGNIKYIGYLDNYFMVALIPQNISNQTLRATFRNLTKEVQELILWIPIENLKPGETQEYEFKLYAGPKKIEEMEKEFPLLTKALYFGIFDFIAKPLLYILKFTNQFTHNFGWDIVILTVLMRILFFPLNHISYKSMKRMQELQPVLQKLKEKYKDDPQNLNKEIMNLYKTHKINPFSGCLPILIQIPVFIAFYKVLLMSVELRHAPFMLWIDDLSAPERLYLGSFYIPFIGGVPLLTILMGASMYVQQKLSPSPPDPTQAKIMLLLPIFFTILFINFPSGLVLYWFVNNILSILQQFLTLKLTKN